MGPLTIYMLKSASWLSVFSLVYLVFLRNERYFLLKRTYLLTGILFSLLLPLFSIHYTVELPFSPVVNDFSEATLSSSEKVIDSESGNGIRYDLIIATFYLCIVLFLFTRSSIKILRLFRIIKKSEIKSFGNARIIQASEFSSPFSFINYIFVNPESDEKEMEVIMNHELVHVDQKHWLDLLFGEMIRILQWANPFAWIYTGFIRLNHEYIADDVALQRSPDPALYKATLLNHIMRSPVVSLSNNFNYSVNKTRFEMMKTKNTSSWRKLKVLIILPFLALLFYAFAKPDYKYADLKSSELTVSVVSPVFQKGIKGVVMKEDGTPLKGVTVRTTGTQENSDGMITKEDGRFAFANVPPEASIIFLCSGYKEQFAKPDYTSEMKIKMEVDPEHSQNSNQSVQEGKPGPLIVLDGVVTKEPLSDIYAKVDIAVIKRLTGKESTDKYGDAGKNGVTELYSKEKAIELGIQIPFRREKPEDFPTFKGKEYRAFNSWLPQQIKYPADAASRGIQGRVTAIVTVNSDGRLSDIKLLGNPNPALGNAVLAAIQSAPDWEPARNPQGRTPFQTSVTLRFLLPDKVLSDETFVAVEEMPMYPGGDAALLDFIRKNTKYPEEAKANKIQGRVIVRFVVNEKGNVEDAVIMKGVDPLLDDEAIRVVNSLGQFKPGMQGGNPVSVYYMVPISFGLPENESKQ
jgi:TonB family protein